jgi:hypothetical protein
VHFHNGADGRGFAERQVYLGDSYFGTCWLGRPIFLAAAKGGWGAGLKAIKKADGSVMRNLDQEEANVVCYFGSSSRPGEWRG